MFLLVYIVYYNFGGLVRFIKDFVNFILIFSVNVVVIVCFYLFIQYDIISGALVRFIKDLVKLIIIFSISIVVMVCFYWFTQYAIIL